MSWTRTTWPPEALRGTGWLYFIGPDHGPIKIGFTTRDPGVRLAQLQTGHPDRLHVIFAFRVTSTHAETALHRSMDQWRVRGEWFEEDAVIEFLAIFLDMHPGVQASIGSTGLLAESA